MRETSHLIIPTGTKPQTFRYNPDFGGPPSEITDNAWASLFPEQGGFFKHPDLAPERSAFAVFHQLHCLDGIRQGYYSALTAALKGEKLIEEDLPMMYSPPHIRHCIDLLRQTLICQPDTTIEIKNKDIGGVTGFGTEHQCRDWEQLVGFTRTWQTYKQDPREDEEMNGNSSHMHHHHD